MDFRDQGMHIAGNQFQPERHPVNAPPIERGPIQGSTIRLLSLLNSGAPVDARHPLILRAVQAMQAPGEEGMLIDPRALNNIDIGEV